MPDQPERAQPVSTTDVDRRRAERSPAAGTVRARTSASELRGTLRDRSLGGLFLELEVDLVLEVELPGDEGDAVWRRVRLLRSQRLPGGRSGLAVEFLDRT